MGFLWSSLKHFRSIFLFHFLKWYSTFCWILDLHSLKLVCFMVANTWEQKYADSWLFWHDQFRMAILDPYFIKFYKDDDVWKHIKYWLSSSNALLKHSTYFPHDTLINSKRRYLLNFRLLSTFEKFHGMLRHFLKISPR